MAAFDADEAGRMLVEVACRAVENVAIKTGRGDVIFQVHLPAQEGEDWNQFLQRTVPARASPRRAGVLERSPGPTN